MNTKRVVVCFSPKAYSLYKENFDFGSVVVIDVLRATTSIITGLANGVAAFIPVATLEEARDYHQKGYIVAAERNAKKIEEFLLDNSPLHYINENFSGKTIVITTTNGTMAIELAKNDGKEVILASFSNITAVSKELIRRN